VISRQSFLEGRARVSGLASRVARRRAAPFDGAHRHDRVPTAV